MFELYTWYLRTSLIDPQHIEFFWRKHYQRWVPRHDVLNVTVTFLFSAMYHDCLLHCNVEDKDKPEHRQEAVYKIKCCDRQATYIGETGSNLCTRSTDRKQTSDEEWRRQQSQCWTPFTDETSNWLGLYDLYYDSITYSTDYDQRRSLESWFTNLEQTPLNRSEQLPAPNKRLIDETK